MTALSVSAARAVRLPSRPVLDARDIRDRDVRTARATGLEDEENAHRALIEVRLAGRSGQDLPMLSSSHVDPQPTSRPDGYDAWIGLHSTPVRITIIIRTWLVTQWCWLVVDRWPRRCVGEIWYGTYDSALLGANDGMLPV